MRKKNAFTLIEVLAVLAILAVLIIIAVPVSFNVFKKIKNDNLNEKISMIEVAASSYGSKIKDEVKNAKSLETGSVCKSTSVEELITLGYLSSEKEDTKTMINPVDNMELTDKIQMCYCESILDVVSYYTKEYKENTTYRKDDKIWNDNKLYKVLKNYTSQSIQADLANENIKEINVCDLSETDIYVNFNALGGEVIDKNGEKMDSPSIKLEIDGKYGTLPTARKVGYTFNKWLYNNKEVKETDKIKVNQTHTLNADYTPIQYRIEYNLNGGTFGATHPDYGKYDTIVPISNPTKEVVVKFNNDEGASLSQSEVRVAQKFRGWKASGVGLNAKANDEAWNGDVLTFANNFLNLRDDTNTSVIFDARWEDTTVTIPTATKPGYKCYITEDSAKTNKITTSEYTIHGGSSATVNLYVKCDPDNFTVTFNANGGSVSPTSKQVLYGLSYGDLPTPTKNLYTFDGWYDSNNNRVYNTTIVSIASNHTLTARWAPRSDIPYIVIYKFKNKNGVIDEAKTTRETKYGKTDETLTVSAPNITGYSTPDSQSITLNSENKELTFVYTKKSVYVTYISSAKPYETASTNIQKTGTLYYGEPGQQFLQSIAVQNGYYLSGWSTTQTNQSAESYALNSSSDVINAFVDAYSPRKTLYTIETPNSYYVRYDCNGGTGAPANSYHTNYQDTYLSANTCSKSGYSFAGWTYGGVSYSNQANLKNLVIGTNNSTITFTAKWTPNVYTISFNSNGGSGSMTSQTFTYGVSNWLKSNTFTKDGYKFSGWSTSSTATSASYSNGQYTSFSSSTTLYAVWTRNSVTVSFNANGGTGTMNDQSFTYNTAAQLNANTFTRNGYEFLGWSTSSTATSATYTNQQSVSFTSNTTLYAVWRLVYFIKDGTPIGGYTFATTRHVTGAVNWKNATDVGAVSSLEFNLNNSNWARFGIIFKPTAALSTYGNKTFHIVGTWKFKGHTDGCDKDKGNTHGIEIGYTTISTQSVKNAKDKKSYKDLCNDKWHDYSFDVSIPLSELTLTGTDPQFIAIRLWCDPGGAGFYSNLDISSMYIN